MKKAIGRSSIASPARCLILLFTLFVLTGCAGLDAQRMVPQSLDQTEFRTNEGVRKILIGGEKEESFGGPAFATKDQILEATQTVLRQSGFFDSVDEGKGNIDLDIIVRSQNQIASLALEYRATITITYRFTNSDGKIVWLKTLESGFSSHAFAGATRTVEAREGSVRENLSALIANIRNSWGQADPPS